MKMIFNFRFNANCSTLKYVVVVVIIISEQEAAKKDALSLSWSSV